MTATPGPASLDPQIRSNTGYIPQIDGLRAIAVIAVIINHFHSDSLPSGFLGVDIFFVISGFVITKAIHGRKQRNAIQFLADFYHRRLKRIAPALIFCSLVTGVVTLAFIPTPNESINTGIFGLIGASNLYLWKISSDYFSGNSELNTFLQTWSLGVEEQFYLLFPLITLIAGVTSTGPEKFIKRLAVITLPITIASLIYFIYLQAVNPTSSYYLPTTRAWELGLGVIAYCWTKAIDRAAHALQPTIQEGLGLGLLTLLVGCMAMPNQAISASTIGATTITAALMASRLTETSSISTALNWKPMRLIGLMSFSLYLWHWPILAFTTWSPALQSAFPYLQIALIIVFSASSYYVIENPVRNNKRLGKKLGIPIYLTAIILSAGALKLGKSSSLNKSGEFYTSVQAHMPCEMLSHHKTNNWRGCLKRSTDKPTIFVFGNSHASNLVPSLEAVAPKLGYKSVKYLTNISAFEYATGVETTSQFWNNSSELQEFRSSLKPGDLIVISNQPSLEQIKQLSPLSNPGIKLAIVDDIPKLCDSKTYLPSLAFNGNGCKTEFEQAIQHRKTDELIDFSKRFKATYLDPAPFLCEDNNVCKSKRNGVILYADASPHFSKQGATVLAPFFEANLPKANP